MSQQNNSSDSDKKVVDAEIISSPNDKDRWNQKNSTFGRTIIYTPIYSAVDMGGCSVSFITLFLFLVILVQFGLLAGIGFFFFYICGAILGSLRLTRSLILGVPMNPWAWRTGNWIISFLLTIWLAGGFRQ